MLRSPFVVAVVLLFPSVVQASNLASRPYDGGGFAWPGYTSGFGWPGYNGWGYPGTWAYPSVWGYPGGYGSRSYGRSYEPRRVVQAQLAGTATITNLSTHTVTYKLNELPYTIAPGQVQTVSLNRTWTIEFDPGIDDQKTQRYQLVPGKHQFADQGAGVVFQRVVAPDPPVPPAGAGG